MHVSLCNLGETDTFQSLIYFSRYDLAALPANTIKPFYPLSTLFDDTKESTLSSTTKEVIASHNNTSESLPPETMPRFPTTGHTAQVSIDGHYSSISEPSTGTVKATSAIANACTLHEC